jgi:hypothetical protein
LREYGVTAGDDFDRGPARGYVVRKILVIDRLKPAIEGKAGEDRGNLVVEGCGHWGLPLYLNQMLK